MDAEVYHLFEKYLNNDLSDSEKEAFDKRISDDPEFAETFETYKDINASLEAKEARAEGEEALQQSLKAISSRFFEHNSKEEKAVKVVPLRRWVYVAAASVVILLGVIFIVNRNPGEPTYAQYAQYEALALVERGAEDSLKLYAENYFNDRQYEKAANTLDKLLQREPENTEVKLYLGIALTETDQFEEAETLLKEVISGGSVYQDKAAWHLALAYLKQKKTEACKSALKEIPEGAEKYDQAQQLLEELR